MIIVEGPDGSGKSTLIQGLSLRFNIPVEPRVVDTNGRPLMDLVEWVEKMNKRGFTRSIFDRHRLISNPIYAPIHGRTSQKAFLNPAWVADQTALLYNQDPYIIYCLPPVKEVRRNVFNSESNAWLRRSISNVYEAYVARAAVDMTLRPIHTKIYDYTTDGQEDDPLATFNTWFMREDFR